MTTLPSVLLTVRCRLTEKNKGEDENCLACDELVRKSKRKNLKGKDMPSDSAKTRKVMSILADIEERSEGSEKTIIFSQFTSMLDLLEPFLQEEGVKYVRCKCRYFLAACKRTGRDTYTLDDGSMNKVERERALDRIKNKSSIKVILISFKAGSTGKLLPQMSIRCMSTTPFRS